MVKKKKYLHGACISHSIETSQICLNYAFLISEHLLSCPYLNAVKDSFLLLL